MPRLPEVTNAPDDHLKYLPYDVWGYDAVRAANEGTAAMLTLPAMQAHLDYLHSKTPVDEAGWKSHLEPLMETYHFTPEEVYRQYGSFTLMAADAAEELVQEQNELRQAAAKWPEEAKQRLDELRSALRGISKEDDPDPEVREAGRRAARRVDTALSEDFTMPLIFHQWRATDAAIAGSGQLKGWTKWLSEDATNTQLLNFMQWHNARIEKYNTDPQIRTFIEKRRERYIDTITQLYDAGYLHPDGRNYNMQTLKHIIIYAGDEIEQALTSSMGHARIDEGHMVMQPKLFSDLETTTFEHELSHFVARTDRLWADEMSADYLAGIVAANSVDVTKAMNEVMRNTRRAYIDADKEFSELFKGFPDVAKAFLRYASAPPRAKAEARAEMNAAFDLAEGEDLLDMIDDVMTKAMPEYAEEPAVTKTA